MSCSRRWACLSGFDAMLSRVVGCRHTRYIFSPCHNLPSAILPSVLQLNFVCIYSPPHRPLQIVKLHNMKSSMTSCYFRLLISKYSPQYAIFKLHQPTDSELWNSVKSIRVSEKNVALIFRSKSKPSKTYFPNLCWTSTEIESKGLWWWRITPRMGSLTLFIIRYSKM